MLKLWVFKYTRHSDLVGYTLDRSRFPNLVARVFRRPTPGGAREERLTGSGWSRASQKVGGDKNPTGWRCNQVAVFSFLNSLWMGKIYLKV